MSFTNLTMPQYHIWTIGCQMNRAESERLSERLRSHGYSEVPLAADADIIVVNSCVVRQNAEDKVVNKLQNLRAMKARNPLLRIVLTGCIVGQNPAELSERFPFVDDFLAPGEFPTWLQLPSCTAKPTDDSSVCSYVPIIQGCNNFCSYCIVPYRRGREKSRTPDEIISEVKHLVLQGKKEITLVGQTVDSYGHDLTPKTTLAQLLVSLNNVPGLSRIRFLTNHPKDMSPDLIEAMSKIDKVCRQINLPIQSGDDAILKAMRRGYSAQDYSALVARLRQAIPDIAISTDIIVGFPDENDEQFQNTFKLLKDIRFDSVHVAMYSPRPGTLAAREYTDNVDQKSKKERITAVEALQKEIATEINNSYKDRSVEVLVEGTNKGRWKGRTRSDKIVFFSGGEELVGKTVSVNIEKTGPWSLKGRFLATLPEN